LLVEWFGIGKVDPQSRNAAVRLAANEEVRGFLRACLRFLKSQDEVDPAVQAVATLCETK
ncbi:MAG: hypothetical protein ACYTBZ_29550, partial [Planctomycetota bacterium]